jgi:two-component system nitrate/nitrite response regulator NarL
MGVVGHLRSQKASPGGYVSASSMNSISIVIADDHALFRAGLRLLLECERDLRVLAEAADGVEALTAVRTHRPDILLLDLAMPRQPGLEVLRSLAASAAAADADAGAGAGAGATHDEKLSVRTILLTAAIDNSQVIEALQLGAQGVVMKDCAPYLLVKGIRAVVSGEYWVGRERVTNLVHYLRSMMSMTTQPSEGAQRQKFGLTKRELQIISAIVGGYTNKEIAQRFSLSEDTVKHHLTNIFDKCGLSNRLELALFAVNHRLVETP